MHVLEYHWTSVIPGMAVRLNCSSPCLPRDVMVTWSLLVVDRTRRAVALTTDDNNYVLLRDNSLVILSVQESRDGGGTFECSYRNTTLTRHTLALSRT